MVVNDIRKLLGDEKERLVEYINNYSTMQKYKFF